MEHSNRIYKSYREPWQLVHRLAPHLCLPILSSPGIHDETLNTKSSVATMDPKTIDETTDIQGRPQIASGPRNLSQITTSLPRQRFTKHLQNRNNQEDLDDNHFAALQWTASSILNRRFSPGTASGFSACRGGRRIAHINRRRVISSFPHAEEARKREQK